MKTIIRQTMMLAEHSGEIKPERARTLIFECVENLGALGTTVRRITKNERIVSLIGDIGVSLVVLSAIERISLPYMEYIPIEHIDADDYVLILASKVGWLAEISLDDESLGIFKAPAIIDSWHYLQALALSTGTTLKECLQNAYDERRQVGLYIDPLNEVSI